MAPFLLAAFFGLLISALLYFVFMWPSREPPEPADDNAGDSKAGPDSELTTGLRPRQGG
jgi:hypothetical protein